jgi:hypothetical protein
MAQAGLDRDKTQAASSPWTYHFRGLSRLGLESGLARGNTNSKSANFPILEVWHFMVIFRKDDHNWKCQTSQGKILSLRRPYGPLGLCPSFSPLLFPLYMII